MADTSSDLNFTIEERLHLDVDGYLIVPGFLPQAEVISLREEIVETEQRFLRDGTRPRAPGYLSHTSSGYFRIDNLPHLATCFHRYLSSPRLVGRVEEMIGHEPRLEQSDAHIRRRVQGHPDAFIFHRSPRLGLGSVERNGLYHYPFVKALTNLTELDRDDGGTAVIPGSHKLPAHLDPVLIQAVSRDPSLIAQVVAPAGSTLFFYESLIHSAGINRSGKDRVLVIGGFTPTIFQPYRHPDPAFVETLDEREQALYSGSKGWEGVERHRSLSP